MAIHARLYSENLAFPFIGDDGGGNLSQDFMENVCGFNDLYLFNLQQEQEQHQFHQSQPTLKNQDSNFDNLMFNEPISSIRSRLVAEHIQKQNQEIEGFINLQHERLRIALQAYKKQQFLTILKNYESKSEQLLRKKEDGIKQATSRRIELEEFLRRTEIRAVSSRFGARGEI